MSSTRHYSDYLTSLASLVGIPATRITTELADVFQTLFNTAMQNMWSMGPWLDVCPFGEARFVGNRLSFPNKLSTTAVWTGTGVTFTPNAVSNPADGLVTACGMTETAATSNHKVTQPVATFFPATDFRVSFYARANGRDYVQLLVNDGAQNYGACFNLNAGTVTSVMATSVANMAKQPNGFWLCMVTFTTAATASSSGSYTLLMSPDGSSLSYAGDTTKGVYVWGNLVQQAASVPVSDSLISWAQPGEHVIETIFDAWGTSPLAVRNPRRLTYDVTPQGIQLINASPVAYNNYVNGVVQQSVYGSIPSNPVYLYYRKSCPSFSGTPYDSTLAYALDRQVYYTNAAGQGDFYRCVIATTAGQSPAETAPTSWEALTIYDSFFQYCIYRAYSDWLISDGQMDKASGAQAMAQANMDIQFDIRERQMGDVLPLKTQTHLTAQRRWML